MLSDIIESLNDPQRRHAAMVHLPISLAVLGALLALISAVIFKSAHIRWLSFATFALLAGTAYFATFSGEDAHAQVANPTAEVQELLTSHEDKANWSWRFAIGVAVLTLVGLAPKTKVRVIASWLAAVGGLFTAAWVAYTGHLGGSLVYGHGVGMPLPVAETTESTETTEPAAHDDPRLAFFVEEAHPVLAENCLRCHNPSRLKRVGNLDLTTVAGILKGGVSGPAIVPGNGAESLLVKAMRYEIEDLEMPADEDQLAPEIIAKIERWIDEGAVWTAVEAAPAEGE